jgi:hypothetical protein
VSLAARAQDSVVAAVEGAVMPKKKPAHGGARLGAGRKLSDPSGARRPKTVWLSPAEIEHCERLAGSVSAAVQLLLARSIAGK